MVATPETPNGPDNFLLRSRELAKKTSEVIANHVPGVPATVETPIPR
jgi:hypothetical protein